MFHLFTSTPTNIFAKMNSETMMKKRPVNILTHKNWREWFQLIELYFTGEELDFMLHQMEEEYCAVLGFTVQSGESTNANTPVTDREGMDKLGKSVSIQDCAGAYGPCAGALLISILQTMCSGALQLKIP